MCVPMDYAKKDHLVMFCNGHGDILRKPFSVKNSYQYPYPKTIYTDCIYHQNEKGKPCEIDLPLLKNDITAISII